MLHSDIYSEMNQFDARELQPSNRERRRQRLNRLKQSVAAQHYRVNPSEVANEIIRETGFVCFPRYK
jgi:anti-sigma28 factor (negative regulator of flagellin synthesis)